MQSSSFQFTNPFLAHFEFEINTKYLHNDDIPINIPITFNVHIDKKPSEFSAIVELTVELGERDESSPFFIKAVEAAKFEWQKSEITNPDNFLEVNAPALLLSYLRPVISTITAASPFNAYNIPFIDFTKG